MLDTFKDTVYTELALDLIQGFEKNPKRISSRYFYDEKGDELFRAIMELEEYYPTACEFEILEKEVAQILKPFLGIGKLTLVEFGAGDGKKTKLLLRFLHQNKIPFCYTPIDISGNILKILESDLNKEFPGIEILPIRDEYFSALSALNNHNLGPKLLLFLGSNIGNLTPTESIQFLTHIHSGMHPGDGFLLGADLKKDPATILKAYNDSQGITREFNLNILDRINKELKGDIDRNQFYHYPTYDPESGMAKSFLVSRKDQVIHLEGIDQTYFLKEGEPIYLEHSQKYEVETLHQWANKTGFKVLNDFRDSKKYFVDSLWERI